MNRKRIYLIALLAVLWMATQAQISFPAKMGKVDGMVSMTISKAFLKMQANNKDKNMAGFVQIVDKLSNIQMMNLGMGNDNPKPMVDAFLRVVRKNRFEELMTLDYGDNDKAVIYHHDYGHNIHQYALLKEQLHSAQIVVLTGSLTLQDVQNVMKEQK